MSKAITKSTKKGVKFDNMSTGQKVIHVWGWVSAVSFAIGVTAMLTGAVAVSQTR